MRPSAIVMLKNICGDILAHELFFSLEKARRSFRIAKEPDKDGWHTLTNEWGEDATQIRNASVEFCFIGEYVSTSKDRFRKSFLNLTEDERKEIAERFLINSSIVDEISQIERNIAEGRRSFDNSWPDGQSAQMRQVFPSWLARVIMRRF